MVAMTGELAVGRDSYDDMVRFYEMEHETFLEDLALYQGFAARCGGPLLELGCGTGRLFIPLAQVGFEVTGVDCSAPMLACARRKMTVVPTSVVSKITLIQGDMRSACVRAHFPMVFIPLNTFVHLLTRQDQQRALAVVAHHLSPEGRLIIDLANPALLLDLPQPLTLRRRWEDEESGETIIKFTSAHFDPASQLEELILMYDVIDADGKLTRSVYPFTLRYTYRHEMELLLELAGLRTEACYGSYELAPYGTQSERMIFVACHSDA
jgi:SAM-dependent methyltransferase